MALYKKGQSGNPNGRPVGTVRKHIDAPALMRERNYCPIKHAMDLLASGTLSNKETIDLIKMLADKAAPNLKAIEHKTDDTQHDAMLAELKTVMSGLAEKFKRDY